MQSFLIITATIAAAVTVGILQNSRLGALKRQSDSLEERFAASSAGHPAGSSESPPAAGQASEADRDSLHEGIVAAFLAFKDRSRPAGPDPAARRRTMLLTAAKFGAEDIEHLFQQLRNDPRLAGPSPDEILELCLEIFAETSPAATMKFLEGHRELREWDGQYARCQRQFLIANPRDAIRSFEQQAAAGNPDVENSGIRQTVLLQEARIDPDKMLARALSPDFATDADALARLGSVVASTLHQPSEHQRFLAALRRAQAGADPSPQLETIRAD